MVIIINDYYGDVESGDGFLKLKILRTSAVNRRASSNGNKSNKQSSFGFDIQVGNGIAFSILSC
jgi:hypothetical protein